MSPKPPPVTASWAIGRGRSLPLDRPRILAILNVTPDSFSDGGQLAELTACLDRAATAVAEGADALDVGGESTRPGSARVPPDEQLRRVLPVVRAIRRDAAFDRVPITIDTTCSPVAATCLDAGADGINDVSAGTDDPAMLPLAAARGAGVILMHRLAVPSGDSYSDRYASPPDYGPGGVVACVREFLAVRGRAALDAGIARESIVLDPGLGFGKTVDQNLELIRRTGDLSSLGCPVLSGLSRKSFVARAAGLGPGTDPRTERLIPTVALSVMHRLAGASVFRVHDVAAHVQALRAVEPETKPSPTGRTSDDAGQTPPDRPRP